MSKRFFSALAVAVFVTGCGNSIGGPCTVATDCPNQVCINAEAYAPGGYCSKQCTVGQDSTCSTGSTCVANGISSGIPGCFKTCTADKDCRNGYTCQTGFHSSSLSVCAAPVSAP